MESTKKSNRHCSVPQCSTTAKENVSFHYFPKEKNLAAEWKRVLGIGKPVTKYMNVCSLHFKDTDFCLPDTLAKKRYLKKGIIPSENVPQMQTGRKFTENQKKAIRRRSERAEKRKGCLSCANPITHCSKDVCEEFEATKLEDQEEMPQESPLEDVVVAKMREDKEIQVTPSIVESHKKMDLVDMIKTNSEMKAFTGIPTIELLDQICDASALVEKDIAKTLEVSLRERIILTFVKLKQNISFSCLSVLFGMTADTCKNHFYITIQILMEVLKPAVPWLPKDSILKRMPICFGKFQKTRIVLDCLEIAIEKNTCLKCRNISYSHCKGDHTIKILIGVSPSGLITFVSDVYGGKVSDTEIFLQSGLLDKVTPFEDAIMVHKGLLIENECNKRNIELIRPPFLGKNKQFSSKDALYASDVAEARIHVKQSIKRLKTFKILVEKIPTHLVPHMDNIINIIAGIVNLTAPILDSDKY